MMRKCFVFLLGALGLMSANMQAKKLQTIIAPVKSATVYFDGAEVFHTPNVALEKGLNEFRIKGLCRGMDEQSVHLKLPDGVSVVSLSFDHSGLGDESYELPRALQELKDSVDFYERKKNSLISEIAVDSALIKQLEAGSVASISATLKSTLSSNLDLKLNQFRTTAMKLYDRMNKNKSRLPSIEDSVNYLGNEYHSQLDNYQGSVSIVHLTVLSERSGTFPVKLSYFTSMASWKPFYDLNVVAQDKPVSIVCNAKVSQSTGVNWTGIPLVLSADYPQEYRSAPVVRAWFVGYAEKSPYYLNNSNRMIMADVASTPKLAANRNFSSGVAEDADDINESTDLLARMNKRYQIELPYSIEGNGHSQIVKLLTKETMASFAYQLVPRLSDKVYLIAKLKDWEKLGLMGGMMNITYQHNYVGESLLNIRGLARDEGITLGTASQIAVSRTKIKDFGSQSFFGNTVKQIFGYRTCLTNTSNKAVSVDVYEQYPISKEGSLEVDLINKQTTSFDSNEAERGVVKWTVTLNPGQNKVLDFAFSVKYPKGKQVRGLDD